MNASFWRRFTIGMVMVCAVAVAIGFVGQDMALIAFPRGTPPSDPKPPASGKLVLWSGEFGDIDHGPLHASAGVWTPDGKYVLSAGWARSSPEAKPNGEVHVWDASAGKLVRAFRGTATSYAFRAGHLAISPDGKTVAAGGFISRPNPLPRQHFVDVWDWDGDRPRLKLEGFDRNLSGVAFSPDGKTLAAVDTGGVLQAWEATSGKILYRTTTTKSKGTRVWGLTFHPTRPLLAITDEDGGIWFFDSTNGKRRGEIKDLPCDSLSAAFAPDGRTIACGGIDDDEPQRLPIAIMRVKIPETGDVVSDDFCATPNLMSEHNVVYQVVFSRDGKLLAAACSDKTVRVFDAATLRQLAVAKEHSDFVYSVAFSPDGKRLLSVGRDAVKVWSVAELMKRKPIAGGNVVRPKRKNLPVRLQDLQKSLPKSDNPM